MTATVPNQDAAPSGAVVLSEREAIDTLRVIAALHGGYVNALVRWHITGASVSGDPAVVGLCVLLPDDARIADFDTVPRWVWWAGDGRFERCRLRDREPKDSRFVPGGRIDRGLGAIR